MTNGPYREPPDRVFEPVPEWSICARCKYGKDTYNSVLAVCHHPVNGINPVTGKPGAVSCEKKNRDGDCQDFVKKTPKPRKRWWAW